MKSLWKLFVDVVDAPRRGVETHKTERLMDDTTVVELTVDDLAVAAGGMDAYPGPIGTVFASEGAT